MAVQGGVIQRVGHRENELLIFHGDGHEPAFAHELDRKRVLKYRDLRKLLGRHVADTEMLAQVAHHFGFRQGADVDQQFADPLARLFLKIQSGVQLFLRHRALLEQVLPEELPDSQVFNLIIADLSALLLILKDLNPLFEMLHRQFPGAQLIRCRP